MRLRYLLALSLAATLGFRARLPAQSGGAKAFIGARVIDGTTAAPIENATIVVRDGRIADIGPATRVTIPAEARTMVADISAMKVDIIKMRVDDTLGTVKKMPPEIYRAVIDEAHKRGLRVAVHIFYLADAKAVIGAGADFIAHSVRDADV